MNEIWALLVTWISYSMSSWDGYPWIQWPNLEPVVRRSGGVSAVSHTLLWHAEGTFYLHWSKHNINFTRNSSQGHQFSSQKLAIKVVMHITKCTPCKVKQTIQGYSKWLSGCNCPAAIPYQIRETTIIWQFHSKVVCTVSRDRVRVYRGTEGTNQNRHWNHHRWHATNSLEWT